MEKPVAEYPATFTDARGTECVTLYNDSATLRMSLRGVTFEGSDFDQLEPVADTPPEALAQFTLNRNELCGCTIECKIPIPMQDGDRVTQASLHMRLELGHLAPNGGLDREHLVLVLKYNANKFVSFGRSGWFEDELLDLQKQLPTGVFMRACINCLYSDYSPLGHGLFGGMMCFRNLKQQYIQVKTKAEFWPIHGKCDRFVQETYLCPEFERRIPGTGYRG